MNKNKNEEKLLDNIKKIYRDNMTDEQKQKQREANRRHQKEYRDNMSDEQKQKQKDYQKEYRKKYYAAKKLNKIISDSKIIDDKINDDNDFYCISIIVKLKKDIVPIKYINSILKINKKKSSQVYLEEYNFINDSYNKND